MPVVRTDKHVCFILYLAVLEMTRMANLDLNLHLFEVYEFSIETN